MPLNLKSEKKSIISILTLSILIFAFLIWWIYAKETGVTHNREMVEVLPYLNSFLNALTSVFLILGHKAIKTGNRELHKKLMLGAGSLSATFLMSYLLYHHYHGDTQFVATGLIRITYFLILISHVILSMIQVPLILFTFYLAFKSKWELHKKMAKITFPIWLYVSVTGVVIFIFLKFFNH
jgi:putative membrane protein